MHQLLIARKFSDKFSLQLMPTLVYFNVVPYGVNNSNYVGSIGLGGKYKLAANKNFTFEYARQLNMYENLMDKNGNIVNYKPDLVSLGWNKYSFMHQLQIARKFSDKLSLQLMPTLVYFNVVPYGVNNSNYVGSLGLGGKYKLSANKNFTFEYARQLNMYENLIDKNGNIVSYEPDLISLGMEFNTGGHLFQFYIGNTTNSSNIDQLARNTTNLKLRNWSLGFTLNRSLNLKK